MIISGEQTTAGQQGNGFQLSKAQPEDDLRPYLQYILFASLLGADAEKFEIYGDKFGYDSQVKFSVIWVLISVAFAFAEYSWDPIVSKGTFKRH